MPGSRGDVHDTGQTAARQPPVVGERIACSQLALAVITPREDAAVKSEQQHVPTYFRQCEPPTAGHFADRSEHIMRCAPRGTLAEQIDLVTATSNWSQRT